MFEEAVSNLHCFQQRTLLALLGIAVGAASVVALLNIGSNSAAESIRQFEAMGTNILVINNGPSMAAKGHSLGLSSAEGIRKEISAVSVVAPISVATVKVKRAKRSIDSAAIGVTPELFKLAQFKLSAGRFLSDFDGHETYAVLGREVANTLRDAGLPIRIGEKVHVDDYLFTVVGILEYSPRNSLLPVDFNESVLLPIKSIRRTLASDGGVSSIFVKVTDGFSSGLVASEVRGYFDARRSVQIQIQSAQQLIDGLETQSRIFTLLLAGIGAVSLLVGGIGVMNVMLAGVSERKREIGVRMAIGARRNDILTMMMLEASGLSTIGGVVGVLLGLCVAYCFALFSGWMFSPSFVSLPIGLCMALFVGLFFGIYPAYKASRLSPIEALRSE